MDHVNEFDSIEIQGIGNCRVKDHIELDGDYIITVDPECIQDSYRNVFRINKGGYIVWQIEELQIIHMYKSYTYTYFEQNQLFAYNWTGILSIIDKDSGRIISSELVR